MADTLDLKSMAMQIACEFESRLPDDLIKKLIKHSEVIGECLIWTGAITKSTGYGKIKYKYKAYDVHRLIGLLAFDCVFETKVDICHINECTSRACIRLSHLYKGTRSSNVIDSVLKGTHNSQFREIHYEHGTEYGYKCGCKCELCLQANRERVYRNRVRGKIIK